MKKLIAAATTLTYLASATTAFAGANARNLNIGAPSQGINVLTSPGTILTNAISIIFVVATLAMLFYLIWGAFNWITSGGDKEAVAKARNRILNALIGLAVLAVAFVIANVAGSVLNVNVFQLQLPRLDS